MCKCLTALHTEVGFFVVGMTNAQTGQYKNKSCRPQNRLLNYNKHITPTEETTI